MNDSHTILDFENTQLHRETYIAVLNSMLRERGAKRKFAATVGITPNYLSQILDPWGDRTPSRELAIRIVNATPLSVSARHDLLHHIRSANCNSMESRFSEEHSNKRLTLEQSRDVMLYLDNYQYHAVYDSDVNSVRESNRMLLKLGKWALARMDPLIAPYHYTEICTSLNGTANTLNLPVTAMWYAKAGLSIAQKPELWSDADREKFQTGCLINALDGVAVSYHNIGLPFKAMEYVNHAKRVVNEHATLVERLRWIPMVAMEELNTLMITPRISIGAAETALDWGLNTLYSGTDSNSARSVLISLIVRNMVECYIQHGSRRSISKAQQIITDKFNESYLRSFGPLIHTMHLRTGANLYRKIGDFTSYQDWTHQALELSKQAGLKHQIAEIEAEVSLIPD